jgi:hypothetical protein
MSDYWPIPKPFRTNLVNRMVYVALSDDTPRHVISACRILFTASRLNLRNRLLPREEVPRVPLESAPMATRREYEELLESEEEYMNYRHDWEVHKAGYPPDKKLKYLDFPIYPGITPATLPDRSREVKFPQPPERLQHESWEEIDLWPIPAEHREGVIGRLMRFIANPPDVATSLSASRTMLFGSNVNLLYQKAGDMPPPFKPWPPPNPNERDFSELEFCDAQWNLFMQDRMLRDDGYPPGETFRWLRSPARIHKELVNWELVNKALDHCKIKIEDGW